MSKSRFAKGWFCARCHWMHYHDVDQCQACGDREIEPGMLPLMMVAPGKADMLDKKQRRRR